MAKSKSQTKRVAVQKKAAAAKPAAKVLILKCVGPNGEAYGGFRWPLKVGARVKCKDWDPKPECGNGLHGWLFGEGNLGNKRNDLNLDAPDNKWIVFESPAKGVVDLGGKVKVKNGTIVYVGDRGAAATYIAERHRDKCVHYATATAGDSGTATAGDYGTATAGDRGTATAGDRGTATAGNYGTATAGYCGTATAGNYGTLNFLYWDPKRNKYLMRSFEVGDDSLKPNVKYRLNSDTLQPEEVSQ